MAGSVALLYRRCVAQTCFPMPRPKVCPANPHSLSTSPVCFSHTIWNRGCGPCSITAVTEANPTHTILSVDGVGAYDNISRNSMLQGFRDVPEANRCLPFVKMFYGAPSHYIWHSATGEAHIISQAEGGEQGDPLMPALFSLGQRSALHTIQQHLLPNESLLAFLDDVYVVVPPDRVRPVYDTGLHPPKPSQHPPQPRKNPRVERSWHRTTEHQGLAEDVWVGNPTLPATSQGMTVLGAPIGSAAFVQHQLQHANQHHQHLLDRIPHLEDLQASWLLLLYCASPIGAPIFCACVRPTSPPSLPTTMTSRLQHASAASSKSRTSPPRL